MFCMSKIYALFKYSYDYYEWEDFELASYDPMKLYRFYKDIKHNCKPDIKDRKKSDLLRNVEEPHYVIKEIEVI